MRNPQNPKNDLAQLLYKQGNLSGWGAVSKTLIKVKCLVNLAEASTANPESPAQGNTWDTCKTLLHLDEYAPSTVR
jgi:hypothetical protein